MEEQGKPGSEVEVAKAAGTLFQVGFEMKDGVAVLGVAGAGDFAELLGDLVPLAEDEAGDGFVVELLIEGKAAGEEAVIEGREGELGCRGRSGYIP